ncbi:hypothetical protein FLK95_19745 [Salmonella enterica]|nr:hypothetical protein [Salmonella enterica]EAR8723681.1 hypothetical protein [Salmonella enterica]ECG8211688.1 hypothetical protein [Salmonella enterica]ECI9554252.1 hypothetical protein [Salmonella enterica]
MALSPAPSPLHFSWSGRRISEKPIREARLRGSSSVSISADGVIRAAPEKPDPAPVTPPPPRKVQGCYSSPFRH